ncbi:MAG: hypothetical protein LCH96_09515 [Actinobacteria bacterium]|nr:hypothetical protein [Actinomycetota bacterium]
MPQSDLPRRAAPDAASSPIILTVDGESFVLAGEHEEARLVGEVTAAVERGGVIRFALEGGGVLILNGRTVRSLAVDLGSTPRRAL